jgi:hypothetical protein
VLDGEQWRAEIAARFSGLTASPSPAHPEQVPMGRVRSIGLDDISVHRICWKGFTGWPVVEPEARSNLADCPPPPSPSWRVSSESPICRGGWPSTVRVHQRQPAVHHRAVDRIAQESLDELESGTARATLVRRPAGSPTRGMLVARPSADRVGGRDRPSGDDSRPGRPGRGVRSPTGSGRGGRPAPAPAHAFRHRATSGDLRPSIGPGRGLQTDELGPPNRASSASGRADGRPGRHIAASGGGGHFAGSRPGGRVGSVRPRTGGPWVSGRRRRLHSSTTVG